MPPGSVRYCSHGNLLESGLFFNVPSKYLSSAPCDLQSHSAEKSIADSERHIPKGLTVTGDCQHQNQNDYLEHHQYDEGYAWIVLVACLFIQVVSVGLPYSFGVYFIELQTVFNVGPEDVAWLGSLQTGLLFAAGPLVGALVVQFGHRVIVISGGVITTLGIVSTCFAPNIWVATFTYGVLGGLGFSFALVPTLTIIPHYFIKYRTPAFCFASVGCALGYIIMTPIMQLLLDTYGWFGAVILTGAISMQLIVFGALLVPRNVCMVDNNKTFKESCLELYSILRNYKLILFCINNILYNGFSVTVFVMIADYAEDEGIEKTKAIYLLLIIGISNVLGRVTGIILGALQFNVTLIYLSACAISGVSMILPPFSTVYTVFSVCAAVYGYMFGLQLSYLGVVTCQLTSLDQLDMVCGIVMLADGIGAALGPIVGVSIYGMTESYDNTFFVAGGLIFFSAFLMIPQWIDSLKMKKSQTMSDESIEKFTVS